MTSTKKHQMLTSAKKKYSEVKNDVKYRLITGEKKVHSTVNNALTRTEKRYNKNHLGNRKTIRIVLIGIIIIGLSFCAGRMSTMRTQSHMYKTFTNLQQIEDISHQYNKVIDQLGYTKERAMNKVNQETQKALDTAKTIQERIRAATKINELIDEQRLFLKEKGR